MQHFIIEPLHTSHKRELFFSGVEALDIYLKKQATQDMKRYIASVFVAIDPDSQLILGYYTLSCAQVVVRDLPQELIKRLPKYPALPAALIGRLAVDKRVQGQGVGAYLLIDALQRAMKSDLAAMAVLVKAKDESAMHFYQKYGFEQMQDDKLNLFLPMSMVRKLFPE